MHPGRWAVQCAFAFAPVATVLAVIWLVGDAARRQAGERIIKANAGIIDSKRLTTLSC